MILCKTRTKTIKALIKHENMMQTFARHDEQNDLDTQI